VIALSTFFDDDLAAKPGSPLPQGRDDVQKLLKLILFQKDRTDAELERAGDMPLFSLLRKGLFRSSRLPKPGWQVSFRRYVLDQVREPEEKNECHSDRKEGSGGGKEGRRLGPGAEIRMHAGTLCAHQARRDLACATAQITGEDDWSSRPSKRPFSAIAAPLRSWKRSLPREITKNC